MGFGVWGLGLPVLRAAGWHRGGTGAAYRPRGGAPATARVTPTFRFGLELKFPRQARSSGS